MIFRPEWLRFSRKLAAPAASLLLGLSLAPLASAQSAPQYVSIADAGPHGSAPHMRVKLITTAGNLRQYAVIFSKDDEALSGLTQFARQYHVQSAHFTAIGAFENARLAWFDNSKRMFRVVPINQQVEVASLIGDIGLVNGKPSVHMHCVVAEHDGSTRGGHILEAHVDPTLEVFVTVDPVPLVKTHDPATGLSLFNPDAK